MRRPRHLLWVAPAAVVLVLVLPPAVRERAVSIFDLRDESNYDRLCMLDAGLRMVAERPLLGLGPGVVETRYPLYRHPTAPRDHRPHLHDSYLQLAAEYGVLALVAFVAILIASFGQTLRNYRRDGGASRPARRPPPRRRRRAGGLYSGRVLRRQLGRHRGPENRALRHRASVLPRLPRPS